MHRYNDHWAKGDMADGELSAKATMEGDAKEEKSPAEMKGGRESDTLDNGPTFEFEESCGAPRRIGIWRYAQLPKEWESAFAPSIQTRWGLVDIYPNFSFGAIDGRFRHTARRRSR